MRWEDIILGVILLLVGGYMVMGGVTLATNGTDYHYEYTVKAEQVNEDEMVDEAIDYENVSDAEQRMLFDAFKKSDHFLGGAEAYVHTDEPIENVSNEWRVIEIKGVPMLVSIDGPEKEQVPDESFEPVGAVFGTILGLLFVLMGLSGVIEGLSN
jgi:hypothetical protein